MKQRTLLGTLFISGLLCLLLLAACGGSESPSSIAPVSNDAYQDQGTTNESASGSQAVTTEQGKGGSSPGSTPVVSNQYLIKSLTVRLEVEDPRRSAAEIQTWLVSTDPQAISSGTTYNVTGKNRYMVTLQFAVQAKLYPQIQDYLRDLPNKSDARLLSLAEKVSDVAAQYTDTEARLKTLRIEQNRLLELMGRAQNLTEIIALEQRLTQVETQINSLQGQLNSLNQKTSMYTVTISLEPTDKGVISGEEGAWNPLKVFGEAFASSLRFLQTLANGFIWLLAYVVYLVPFALLGWWGYRRYRRTHPRVQTSTPAPEVIENKE